jgi:ATP-dependent RNA helicase DeaD
MRAALEAGGFEQMRGVVESLVQEFDALDVAAAAIHLVHEASEKSIPQEVIPARAAPESRQEGRPQGFGPRPSGAGRGPAGRPRQRY